MVDNLTDLSKLVCQSMAARVRLPEDYSDRGYDVTAATKKIF